MSFKFELLALISGEQIRIPLWRYRDVDGTNLRGVRLEPPLRGKGVKDGSGGTEVTVMDIRSENGSSFHLTVVGYEFPDKENEGWDSNWLRIFMTVSLPQGTWSVTDPFLLTYEVNDLADWLDSVAVQAERENMIRFVEPNLQLKVIQPADGTRCLQIWFGAECRPPWNHPTGLGGDQEYAEFLLADIDLHSAAESLRSQRKLYPQRGTR